MRIRPSFEKIYMDLAISLSQRSTCQRLQVGTVITSLDYRYVYAIGYNGNASGMQHDCDRHEAGNCGCLHSEENAIINCTCHRDIPKAVFVTVNPCVMCAKRIINMGGVKKLFYKDLYRMVDSIEMLNQVGIKTAQLID